MEVLLRFFYNILANWMGFGLLISNGKKWFNRRKIITPTFHFKILDEFIEIFNANSQILVERLNDCADGKTTLNIMPYICLAALDNITGEFSWCYSFNNPYPHKEDFFTVIHTNE